MSMDNNNIFFREVKHYSLASFRVEFHAGILRIIDKYSDETDYEHSLFDNPIALKVDEGVIIAGAMEFNKASVSSLARPMQPFDLRFLESKNRYLYIIVRDKTAYGFVDTGLALSRVPVNLEIAGSDIKLSWSLPPRD